MLISNRILCIMATVRLQGIYLGRDVGLEKKITVHVVKLKSVKVVAGL